MPNVIQLTSKETGKPESFQSIDDKIRGHLGLPPDPNSWAHGWYNQIGFGLACGRTFEELETIFASDEELKPIVAFLKENYTTDAWYEPK